MATFRIKRYSLEDYEELNDKKISKMTENQMKMLLEDERGKAKRNKAKIVKEHADREAKLGRESGKKSGKKTGTITGGIIGGLGGAAIGYKLGKRNKKVALGTALGAAGLGIAGAGLGRLMGGSIGADEGERSGRIRGTRLGNVEAEKGGHNEITRTLNNARTLDDYARRHKKEDKWETGFRQQLKDEEKARKEEAAKARAEALERRRVEAEEMKAKAEHTRARTDRDRYYDDYFGWGEGNRARNQAARNQGSSYTQNNYYR